MQNFDELAAYFTEQLLMSVLEAEVSMSRYMDIMWNHADAVPENGASNHTENRTGQQ